MNFGTNMCSWQATFGKKRRVATESDCVRNHGFDEDRLAWMSRYQEAVSRHRSELEQGFEFVRADPQSQGLVMTEEAFHMVCRDTFGGLLSEADLDDLALLAGCEGAPAGGPSLVDGVAVLLRN